MAGKRRLYIAYLLRLWPVEDGGVVWRASLETPGSAERHGFVTLADLYAFLDAETRDLAVEERRLPGTIPVGQDLEAPVVMPLGDGGSPPKDGGKHE